MSGDSTSRLRIGAICLTMAGLMIGSPAGLRIGPPWSPGDGPGLRLADVAFAQAPSRSSNLAPYVPTPREVVDRMLALAEVTADDVIYDLGSGDGRIPITAAVRYGARGVGVDIDPVRVAEATANAMMAGVSHLVSFRQQDAMTVNVSDATVVTLYLLSSSNLKLRPILTRQLRPGARIVSHAFSMGDWAPDTVDQFRDEDGVSRLLYLWRADGRVRP